MKQAALEAHARIHSMGPTLFISSYHHLFDFYVFCEVWSEMLCIDMTSDFLFFFFLCNIGFRESSSIAFCWVHLRGGLYFIPLF
jgi:hypothetical protein